MKQFNKLICCLFLVCSLAFSTVDVLPIIDNVTTVEAATKKPAAVKKITKVKSTTTSLKIKIAKANNIKGYQIKVSKEDGQKIKSLKTKKTTVTIKGLKPNTKYKINVRTYIKSGKKTIYSKGKTISYSTKKAKTTHDSSEPQEPDEPDNNNDNSNNNNNDKNNDNSAEPDTNTPDGGYVYLSQTGTKYHSIPNCGNMNPNTARKITKQEAINSGYGACSKCN